MIRTITTILLALLLTAPALAQTGTSKSAAQLNAEIASQLPTNSAGQITAIQLRQVILDLIASSLGPIVGVTATPNSVLAGPASGTTAATPTFRALVPADIPTSSSFTSATPFAATGTPALISAADRAAAQTINIADYGALCDGITDDTVAINAAFTAARTSLLNANGGIVNVTGISDATHKACKVTSVNATGFTHIFATNEIVISNLSLSCSGRGNICLDMTGSVFMHLRNVQVLGSDVDPPEIGIQIGGFTADVHACCIGSMTEVQSAGVFTLAAMYSQAAESMSFFYNRFRNSGSSTAPIRYFGAITPGINYTDGFYTRVHLTGGTGTGATAFVRVQGGAVTIVDVGGQDTNTITSCSGCWQGRNYTIGDVLSANNSELGGGTGTGFSVVVQSVAPYGVILDGMNHWRQTSLYQTVTAVPDLFVTFTYNSFFGGAIQASGDTNILGAALWVAGPRSLLMENVYLLSFNMPTWCVELFDGAVNIDQTYRTGCEVSSTVQSAFRIVGPNRTPEMDHFAMTSGANMTGIPIIMDADPLITGVNMRNSSISVSLATGAKFFGNPQIYTVTGHAYINRPEIWNAPLYFSGTLCVGGPPVGVIFDTTTGVCASPNGAMPNLGPLEIQNDPVAAWGCARRLTTLYTGPLCQLERISDNVAIDVYPDALGNFDANTASVFCAGTTCNVRTMYDQSGNANNAVQATTGNQPSLLLRDSQVNNRATVYFGDSTNNGLVVTSSTDIDDIFAATGYINILYSRVGAAPLDRLLWKASAVLPATGTGWEWRNSSAFNGHLGFVQLAGTTDGDWETAEPIGFLHGRLYELEYNSSSVANVPTISVEGTAQTYSVAVQPVGAISSDAGTDMIIGNNAALNRGADGAFGEILIFKTVPTAARKEAIRRNQAIYYGIGNIVH